MNALIKIEKYVWGGLNPDLHEINFFSNSSKQLWGTVTLNAYEDLLSVPPIRDTKDTEDEGEISLSASNVTLKISDLRMFRVRRSSGVFEEYFPRQFFDINQPYINSKFKVTISPVERSPQSSDLFTGIISMDGIKEYFSGDNDSHTIEITAVGREKELKEYYSSVELPPLSGWLSAPTWSGSRHISYLSLESVLSQILNLQAVGAALVLEDSLKSWNVSAYPVLDVRANSGTARSSFFIKSGYSVIGYNGENVYDFLRRLCNTMGWVFYFHLDKFYVRNRAASFGNIVQLDYMDHVSSLTVEREAPAGKRLIVIPDGAYDGNDNTESFPYNNYGKGGRAVFIRSTVPFTNSQNHWNLPGYRNHTLGLNPYLNHSFHFNCQSNDKDYSFMVWKTNLPYITGGIYRYNVPSEAVLKIDGDIASPKFGWVTEVTLYAFARKDELHEFGKSEISNNDFIYTGNYGNCLFKLGSEDEKVSMTYQDYVNDSDGLGTFRSNWGKYSGEKNIISITANGRIPQDSLISFVNSGAPLPIYESNYCILENEFDISTNLSRTKIQKV